MAALGAALAETGTKLKEREAAQARALAKQQKAAALREQMQAPLDAPAARAHAQQFVPIDSLRPHALGEHQLSVKSCDNREHEMRHWLQERIDADDKKRARSGEKIVRAMAEFKEAFKLNTQEVAAGSEYRTRLDKLNVEHLPCFVARFKELLNEIAILEVVNFRS